MHALPELMLSHVCITLAVQEMRCCVPVGRPYAQAHRGVLWCHVGQRCQVTGLQLPWLCTHRPQLRLTHRGSTL